MMGLMGLQIPIDCLHALLALDYYHGCRYERGEGGAESTPPGTRKDMCNSDHTSARPPSRSAASTAASTNPSQSSISLKSTTTTTRQRQQQPLPPHPPHTYHPLYAPLRPTLSLLLLTLYDTLATSLLALFTAHFFTSTPSNLRACNYTPLYPAIFTDPLRSGLSVRQRCWRINIDIHVSGGFDVAGCLLLLGLHVWEGGFRGWEWVRFGRGGGGSVLAGEGGGEDGEEEGEGDEEKRVTTESWSETIQPTIAHADTQHTASATTTRSIRTTGDEEQRTDMGIRHRSAERAETGRRRESKAGRTASVASSMRTLEAAKWSEVLLECLVP